MPLSRNRNGGQTLILVGLLLVVCGSAYGQTVSVWSCQSNCSATSTTYTDGQWRSPTPAPNYVAATNGTNTVCTRNWWNTNGSVRWRRVVDLAANHCVAIKTGSVESFVPASQLGYPPVTPPVDPPPPPARTSVVISVTSQRVYTNEPVTVSWTSQNAQSCTASWTQDPVPFSGSQTITMVQPMAFARVSVRCIGLANEYEAGTGWVVLSRAPDCYAKTPDDRDKVNVKALSAANISLRYQIAAVWWCATPSGPVQQRYVLGLQDQETIAAFRKWLDRQFDEAGVRARCEASCGVLPAGALKTELDEWSALPENSAAVLGVIQP